MDLISCAELKKKIDGFDLMVLLDVRPAEAYAQSHLKGAISLPLSDQMQQEAKVFLKKEDEIIIYADSAEAAAEAFTRLKKNGYPKLRVFAGGMQEWLANGLEVTDRVSMG